MKISLTFVFLFFFSLSSFATSAAPDCKALKSELEALKQAQQHIMVSLVQNHESFADSLQSYSGSVKNAKKPQQRFGVSENMDRAALAIRHRGKQGKKLIQDFEKASSKLLAQVTRCL